MRTVSVEMARKLKKAGLRWKPKIGDFHLQDNETEIRICQYIPPNKEELAERCLWLPSLSDLLEWLEEWGYYSTLYVSVCNGQKNCRCELHWVDTITYEECGTIDVDFVADSRVDAAAKAVLWVLEQEAKLDDK